MGELIEKSFGRAEGQAPSGAACQGNKVQTAHVALPPERLELGHSCFDRILAAARAESALAYQPRVTPWDQHPTARPALQGRG